MPITPQAPGSINAPNDLTEETGGGVVAPNDLTEAAAGSASAPNDLTESAAGSVAAPNDLTETAEGSVSAPNDLTEAAAGSVATPNDLTEQAAGAVSAPVNKTELAAGAVSAPNNLTEGTPGTIAAPNNLAEVSAGVVAAPNDLTELGVGGFPRALVPLLKLDFEDNLYSQNGETVELSDLITYSRASNVSYIDSYLDAKGDRKTVIREDWVGDVTNLIEYSENFSVGDWTLDQAVIDVARYADPFGGSDAFKLYEDETANDHMVFYNSVFTNDNCWSTYVKYAGRHICLNTRGLGAGYAYAIFDLLNGKIAFTGGSNLGHAFIEYVADGWYRCGIRFDGGATPHGLDFTLVEDITLNTEQPSYLGDGESGVYLFGAQCTNTERTTPYIKTSGSAVLKTFVESPRFDIDPATGESLGMVNETASTNLVPNSETYSGYLLSGVTLGGSIVCPDGTTMGQGFTASASSVPHYVGCELGSVTSGSKYTFSVFLKAGVERYVQLTGSVNMVNEYQNFDLLTGQLGATDGALTPQIQYFGDGWYRLSVTGTANGTGTGGFAVAAIPDIDSARLASFAGNAVSPAFYAFGFQMEALLYPTSYIRTEGAPVVRAGDDGSFTNKYFVNPLSKSSDIAIHAKIKASSWPVGSSFGEDIFYFSTLGGLNANRLRVEKYTDDRPYIIYGGQALAAQVGVEVSENTNTLTLSVSGEKIISVFIDGVLVATFTTTQDENPVLGGQVALGLSAISQYSKEFAIFDRALTAEEIKQL